jgi:hypothetical protein
MSAYPLAQLSRQRMRRRANAAAVSRTSARHFDRRRPSDQLFFAATSAPIRRLMFHCCAMDSTVLVTQ